MLFAALSVKVIARMRSGSTPLSTRRSKCATRTVVLPEPGPATTQVSRGVSSTATASNCRGVNPTTTLPRRARGHDDKPADVAQFAEPAFFRIGGVRLHAACADLARDTQSRLDGL